MVLTNPLTQSAPSHSFEAPIRSVATIGTSGDLDGGVLQLRHRNSKDESWVVNPNVNLSADQQLAGTLTVVAKYNQIFLSSPGGSASVVVNLDLGR